MDDADVSDSLAGRPDVSNVLLVSPAFDREGPMACPSYLEPSDASHVSVVGVTVVSTLDEWATGVLGDLGARPEHVCVVVVGEEARSVAASGEPASLPHEGIDVKHVASPGNLTEIGVRLTECIEAIEPDAGTFTLCFESLTALLRHADVRTVFQFLNVLTSLVESNAGFAHYHLDPEAAGELDVARLRPLFDAVVEREGGDVTVRTR